MAADQSLLADSPISSIFTLQRHCAVSGVLGVEGFHRSPAVTSQGAFGYRS